ncbi:hypothetical protein [Mycolicibacterium porcinum]|uniref:hypothetical protein n=1 Tax=Mycolicibacterium porcinum TaxID=39693 RepID=UPI001042417C|nr:hypothetical protein [Mycolicibacterium porcinum]
MSLIDDLTTEAIDQLNAQPMETGCCLFVRSDAKPGSVEPTAHHQTVSVVKSLPNQPLHVRLASAPLDHAIWVPNAPLNGESIVAVRVHADIAYPPVLQLDSPLVAADKHPLQIQEGQPCPT